LVLVLSRGQAGARMEAIASGMSLLAGVGRAVKRAGQIARYLTSMQRTRDKLLGPIANIHAAFSYVKAVV